MEEATVERGIRCTALTKTFNKGATTAIEDISFTVEPGELFGLIGPDGAGKTTLIRVLTTLYVPDIGQAVVDGLDIATEVKALRNRVGYMPGKFSLYQDLTVAENLEFFATLFNTTVQANMDLIHDIYVQIAPFRDRRAGQLSGGMKQKLALCCALIHKPTVLFLDEPTTGVDVVSRKEFWQMLAKLKKQGITILVSTPYMDEATLCDRIALIQEGRIMKIDTPQGILDAFPIRLFALKAKATYSLLCDAQAFDGTQSCFAFGEYLHLTFLDQEESTIRRFKDYLKDKKHQEVVFMEVKPSIEDCFMYLMKSEKQLKTAS
ncbi:ABC-type multidrug transport system ATPase subunit [Dyadobacter jejuensis]|uniref:ABC-type multidrug transport system ATPase subunit n=1 Tax=Dyadobacter jejuensis TaxID=1082580 RepID=A0A316AR86_9BACT|nr:ABC transporter ATP-binding protein [Dyadobacter jejuensis]PWJ59340.1 ABC-type multidrug transport system ATPase subunit [Dyadobacter jejuensis]